MIHDFLKIYFFIEAQSIVSFLFYVWKNFLYFSFPILGHGGTIEGDDPQLMVS